MTPSTAPSTAPWTTWHLHLASAARTTSDRVATDVVGPVARDLGQPWFFLRYWQGGPHVRLRIRDLTPAGRDDARDRLVDLLAVAGELRDEELPFDTARYAGEAGRLSRVESADAVEPHRAPGVHDAGYEPETARYGGPELTPRTEALFELSSELVLDLLPHAPGTRERTVLALRAAVAAASALGGPDVRARYYAAGLEAWSHWNAAGGLDPARIAQLCEVGHPDGRALAGADHGPFTAWHAALRDLADEMRRLGREPGPVVLSHVHMFCNRLGRSLVDELQTYAWLHRAFPVAEAA